MKLVKPSFDILEMSDISLIEKAGRTCYKSEDKITRDSAGKFVKMLDNRGHHAMLEHSFASVRIICDRGVTHEIVRHRLFSYAQESTRYCNYSKDKFNSQITFVIPCWLNIPEGEYEYCVTDFASYIKCNNEIIFNPAVENSEMFKTCGNKVSLTEADENYLFLLSEAENTYLNLLEQGWQPQQARAVLPNSLKTEIVVSGNFREWKHFFNLRIDSAAHPQMREVALPICEEFEKKIPEISWRDNGTASN